MYGWDEFHQLVDEEEGDALGCWQIMTMEGHKAGWFLRDVTAHSLVSVSLLLRPLAAIFFPVEASTVELRRSGRDKGSLEGRSMLYRSQICDHT